MRNIDKLREYVKDAPASSMGEMARAIVAGMADEIERDERSLRGFAERLDAAAAERADVTLFGVDYTPLPVDADGVPIHVGDVMDNTHKDGFRAKRVIGICLHDGGKWTVEVDEERLRWHRTDKLRHHHAPTVEDVLREFAYGLGVPVADSYVAATAAKLRLAEVVDE